MQASDMKRDMKVRTPLVGPLTLVRPVGPHDMLADGSATVRSIRAADEIVEPETRDVFGAVLTPAVTREVWTPGGMPPRYWQAVDEATWDTMIVDAELCEEV